MIELIFTIILMFALGTVLYLMVRALPRVVEDPADQMGFLDRWAHSELPEKADEAINGFLLKFLRRVKVLTLKLDNSLSRHLQKITAEDPKRLGIDFKEMGNQAEKEDSAG